MRSFLILANDYTAANNPIIWSLFNGDFEGTPGDEKNSAFISGAFRFQNFSQASVINNAELNF